jgi:glycine/D-amino acid oxidase-like deaminating enzyme
LPALSQSLTPQRQVVGWFDTGSAPAYRPDAFPVFIVEDETGIYYGFPDIDGGGVKIGRFFHRGETVDPDRVPREIVPEDEAVLRTALGRYLPGANGASRAFKSCMFVLSPDGHFIVDRLPGVPNVAVAAGFSGHGYKFCPAIGEMLADLVTTDGAPADGALFGLSRLASGASG